MESKKRFQNKKLDKEDNKIIENVAKGIRAGAVAVCAVSLTVLKKFVQKKI